MSVYTSIFCISIIIFELDIGTIRLTWFILRVWFSGRTRILIRWNGPRLVVYYRVSNGPGSVSVRFQCGNDCCVTTRTRPSQFRSTRSAYPHCRITIALFVLDVVWPATGDDDDYGDYYDDGMRGRGHWNYRGRSVRTERPVRVIHTGWPAHRTGSVRVVCTVRDGYCHR